MPPLRPPSGHTAKLRLRRIAKQHEKRRERRRAETGVVIHYDRAAWKKLKQADRDAFAAAKLSHAFIGPRWDFQRDFPDYTGAQDAGDHLDHLFRFGSARSVRRELEARR